MPLSTMKISAQNTVMPMKSWNILQFRNFKDAHANTTVTEEPMSTKVLIRPGSTGSVRSGHG